MMNLSNQPWRLLLVFEKLFNDQIESTLEEILITLELLRETQESSDELTTISAYLIGFQSDPSFIPTGYPAALGKSLKSEITSPRSRSYYISQRQELQPVFRQQYEIIQVLEKRLVQKGVLEMGTFKEAWSIEVDDNETFENIPSIQDFLERNNFR